MSKIYMSVNGLDNISGSRGAVVEARCMQWFPRLARVFELVVSKSVTVPAKCM